ncbi:MAG: lytic murein transglycosylase [Rhodobiaceae bacterium]|nr:lytic murein transglycosylase [Rhodobiaceae bacterium]MCC0057189.1 lytic murein transglycosylase [Rhodobiaceae bacterium]
MRQLLQSIAICCLLTLVISAPASASFTSFVNGVRAEAGRAGVSEDVLDRAFRGISPDREVLEKLNRQSEFTLTVGQYLGKTVSDARVTMGREKYREYKRVLDAIESRFGVDGNVVLAIWGMESNFGDRLGDFNVIRSLTTLAYEGRRRDFFRKELITALGILNRGHIAPERMTGSWAGAMGHTQFMPSSFRAYSADYDGDGRHDIWNNVPDALASTANYLKRHGWRHGETWGYEVRLPRGFNYKLEGRGHARTLAEWSRLGVGRAAGGHFPRPSDKAWLELPGGANGPAFLMLPNFRVILTYNNAVLYGLGVGHLADRIVGGGPLAHEFSPDERALTGDQVIELQTRLARLGYDVGDADGKAGPQTMNAVKIYQQRAGLPADGFPSYSVLESLRAGR